MQKYSFELKKKVVDAYFKGEGGYIYLAAKYGVKNKRQVLNWVHYYEKLGDDGLRRSRGNKTYSFEFKLHVVELYLTSEVSYQELALAQGINNNSLVSKWVNDFKIAGPDALRPKKKGRKKSMDSKKEHTPIAQSVDVTPIDTSAEHVKQLEDELLKLRIENAYLKELRRLRLEEEALLKKQRELSTASEESLN
jgi:transposase